MSVIIFLGFDTLTGTMYWDFDPLGGGLQLTLFAYGRLSQRVVRPLSHRD